MEYATQIIDNPTKRLTLLGRCSEAEICLINGLARGLISLKGCLPRYSSCPYQGQRELQDDYFFLSERRGNHDCSTTTCQPRRNHSDFRFVPCDGIGERYRRNRILHGSSGPSQCHASR